MTERGVTMWGFVALSPFCKGIRLLTSIQVSQVWGKSCTAYVPGTGDFIGNSVGTGYTPA
ncbi:hypothetical protein SERLADRAFT_397596 [Serpula lacrymans var. lacrymans S7.9]|nr:uncharacterized protein SERLADRAFT_397596 [Serpula lacrymans var. lacrymans S7.9]EGO21971.1 hypothetical protein SERLADRAFT_397596 [Serpula lacrymans var. lacrymans S7.9]